MAQHTFPWQVTCISTAGESCADVSDLAREDECSVAHQRQVGQISTFGPLIGPAVRADFRRLYPANAKTPTCCPSDDNRTKVTNSVTSARSLWWHVGPYFWPADLTRTANPIDSLDSSRIKDQPELLQSCDSRVKSLLHSTAMHVLRTLSWLPQMKSSFYVYDISSMYIFPSFVQQSKQNKIILHHNRP